MRLTRRLRLSPTDRVTGRPTLAWWFGIALLAVALFAVSVPLNSSIYGVNVALAFALGALQCGALILAPVRPALSIILFVVATFGLQTSVVGVGESTWPWPWAVTSMIAFTAIIGLLTFYRGWQLGLWCYLTALAASAIAIGWLHEAGPRLDSAVVNTIITVSIVGAVYLLTVLVAQRRRIGEQLLHAREITAAEQSRRMLVEERQRVARELHDVVAHSMSLIQVQATTARYRMPDLAPDAAAEFDDIGASARLAMTEMRRLLGVLRNGEDDPELAPQQGIDNISSLVDSASRAGVSIVFRRGEVPPDIPPSVHIAAFRIAQEAISNAVRHAPGSRITVSIGGTEHAVDVAVSNTASALPSGAASRGSGHGLIGMRERASLLGGTIQAGPTADGGYRVRATLPLHADTIEGAS